MLYQLMYFSIAEDGLTAGGPAGDGIAPIIRTAEMANARHGITGFLTFNGSEFLQFIEGPDTSIRQLMDNIELDVRHHSVVTLATGRAAARAFPEWSMQRIAPATPPAAPDADAPSLEAVRQRLDQPFRRAFEQYLGALPTRG